MGLTVKYVRINKAGRYEFRRGVPEALREIIGAREIKKVIGATEAQALAAYPRVRAEVDKLLSTARTTAKAAETWTSPASETSLEAWNKAMARFREFVPEEREDDEGYRAFVVDTLLRPYTVARPTSEQEEEDPLGVPEATRHLINIVNGNDDSPQPTLEDAKRLYRREKIGEGVEAKKTEHRLDRVFKRVEEALGSLPALSALTYDDACRVRDHMLKVNGLKPASVKRELNFVRAAIGFYAKAYPQQKVLNPFKGLEMGQAVTGQSMPDKAREPLPAAVLRDVRARVLSSGNRDLQLIWRLLEGTGCRLAEITGLRLEDVDVTSDLPHITVEWHEDRRIKTHSSRRRVPLVGDALVAAKEAQKLAGNGPMLFGRYSKANGPGNASASLMKHVRSV
ncbi:MAG: hypothetical protein ACP5RC_08225, partial [Halothiobacillaceae bacterium]